MWYFFLVLQAFWVGGKKNKAKPNMLQTHQSFVFGALMPFELKFQALNYVGYLCKQVLLHELILRSRF